MARVSAVSVAQTTMAQARTFRRYDELKVAVTQVLLWKAWRLPDGSQTPEGKRLASILIVAVQVFVIVK
jgi:hypothetical protein